MGGNIKVDCGVKQREVRKWNQLSSEGNGKTGSVYRAHWEKKGVPRNKYSLME